MKLGKPVLMLEKRIKEILMKFIRIARCKYRVLIQNNRYEANLVGCNNKYGPCIYNYGKVLPGEPLGYCPHDGRSNSKNCEVFKLYTGIILPIKCQFTGYKCRPEVCKELGWRGYCEKLEQHYLILSEIKVL